MNERIFLSSPHMSDEGYEQEYIIEAFDTNWIAPFTEIVDCFNNFYNMSENDYIEMCSKALKVWNERRNAETLYSSFAKKLSNNFHEVLG